MSKDSEENQLPEEERNPFENKQLDESVVPVSGLYKSWFLDYASYVILERAVPSLFDGLKPVQRRILHSMKEMEDGRYNKVANIIGNTMKFHPHGDASIGDALVQIGQKELMIDCQGNWGNTLTGDGAAAPRYIEARLSKFALHVAFNGKTTNWLSSYTSKSRSTCRRCCCASLEKTTRSSKYMHTKPRHFKTFRPSRCTRPYPWRCY